MGKKGRKKLRSFRIGKSKSVPGRSLNSMDLEGLHSPESDRKELSRLVRSALEEQLSSNSRTAEKISRQALSLDCADGAVHHNYGILLAGLNRHKEALSHFLSAVDADPDCTKYRLSHIDTLLLLDMRTEAQKTIELAASLIGPASDDLSLLASASGRLGDLFTVAGDNVDAIKSFAAALDMDPEAWESAYKAGNLCKELGKTDEAIRFYERTVASRPDHLEAWNNLGVSHALGRNFESAIYCFKQAISIEPRHAPTYNNMGMALYEIGDLDAAIDCFEHSIRYDQKFHHAHNNLGNCLVDLGKTKAGIQAYMRALTYHPDFAEAHNNLGLALWRSGNLERALSEFDLAIESKPDFAKAYSDRASVLEEVGKSKEAFDSIERAIAIDGASPEIYVNYGTLLASSGDTRAAAKAYATAIELRPSYSAAHRNLSLVRKYRLGDDHFAEMLKLAEDPKLDDGEKGELFFGLAKAYEDIGDISSAYLHFSEGNAFIKRCLGYRITRDIDLFAKLKNTQEQIHSCTLDLATLERGVTPIFVLGMPRSGTTLVEQIVSAHSAVLGGGELPYVHALGSELITGSIVVTRANLMQLRKLYLSAVGKMAGETPFITDKMPHNFLFIPLIRAALPEAKIILMNRDPAAVCWSNFKCFFSSGGMGYSHDLKDCMHYYFMYQDLMAGWVKKYSDEIYTCDYDWLTENQLEGTRSLLDSLKLPWEASCLAPENNRRSVGTASQQQVRQGVYRGSSQEWKKYKQLMPIDLEEAFSKTASHLEGCS